MFRTPPTRRRVLVIAEAGMNHDGSLGIAKQMVDAAAECGVDAVKFQTHIAHAETLRDAPPPPYFDAEPRYEYFTRTAFAEAQWREIKKHCDARGVEFLSSPFSLEAVDLLERVGVARYKVPSGEVTNLPLLQRIGTTGKPVLLSSGMSSWAELDAAVRALRGRRAGVTVLQCTSEYPCPPEHAGLNVLNEMRRRYGLPVGLSDHTLTNSAAIAAVVLGATVVEKHFTLSRRLYGSDAKHSLEPDQFADLVRGIRDVEAMMANPIDKNDVGRFRRMKQVFEKSIVTARRIPKGAQITRDMVAFKKPGTGIPASAIQHVLGARARRNLAADRILRRRDLEGSPSGAARRPRLHAARP